MSVYRIDCYSVEDIKMLINYDVFAFYLYLIFYIFTVSENNKNIKIYI